MTTAAAQSPTTTPEHALATQRAAAQAETPPSADERRRRIQDVIDLLADEYDAIVTAIDADYGGPGGPDGTDGTGGSKGIGRHRGYSIMNDILGSLTSLKSSRDRLEGWMRPQPREMFAPYDAQGATAEVQYRPKGVVGIIGTWNAPVFTLLSPLASVLAAGNRAILKPSEVTPRTAATLARLFAEYIDPSVVAVVTGGPDVAETLTSSPLDHIVFTGSTAIGRKVMRAAAENLVPVTLELGGKSPTVIGRSADLATAARRIARAKAANGGQLCVSADLVYAPRESVDDIVEAVSLEYAALLPTIAGNRDAVSLVDDRHAARVRGYIDDARRRGARVERVPAASGEPQPDSPEPDAGSAARRLPLHVVVDPPAESAIMAEEIFGPALVVLGYDTVDDALADIRSRPAPLALYYFGTDADEEHAVLSGTDSGGVTLNDLMLHPGLEDAPFGGVDASGMGHYHGREGFAEFSHARTVFRAAAQDPAAPDPAGQPAAQGMFPDGFEEMMASMIAR